jgi:undecaprenyl-diphosphatase
MRECLDVLLLAVLQGIAEFLPISSSGHLVLAQNLLGLNMPGVRLEVVLHLGTMISIMAYYRKPLWALACGILLGSRSSWTLLGHIVISAVPAAFFYFLCHDKVDAFYEDPRAVGGFLIFTGIVCSPSAGSVREGPVTGARALLTGIAQALAVLPGISRSGMTIAAARMAGIAPGQAAEFSFLMCLPLLAGAALLDFLGFTTQQNGSDSLSGWLLVAGRADSAAEGYAALAQLVRTLRGGPSGSSSSTVSRGGSSPRSAQSTLLHRDEKVH